MPKLLKFFIVFVIILTWIFYGHPQIWPIGKDNSGQITIPPKIKEARGDIASGDGLLVYSFNALRNKTHLRTYTNSSDSFSASSSLDSADVGRSKKMATSPIAQEAILVNGSSSAPGAITVSCFNGTSWSFEWSTSSVTQNSIGFDVVYEASSGDAMVLYSTNVGTTTELEYKTKSGATGCGTANWSQPIKLDPIRTSGIINWLKLGSDKRTTSTLITAVWLDSNKDVSSMVWSGTSWGNEPSETLELSMETISSIAAPSFDIEYESKSGDVMVVWANSSGADGINGAYYATCTGGTSTCSWSSTSTINNLLDDASHLDLSANPDSDELVFASIGDAGSDLQAAYWSGSAWTGTANLDDSARVPNSSRQTVATGWLVSGSVSRSIIVYADTTYASTTNWAVGNGSSFEIQTDFVPSIIFGSPDWLDIQTDPINKDNLMLVLNDSNSDLFAKRLVMDSTPTFTWTNSDGGRLETSLATNTKRPFSFAYWNFMPSTAATISCATDISATDFGTLDSNSVFTSSPNSSTTMSCSGTSSGCTLKINDAGNGVFPGLYNAAASTLIESPNSMWTATSTLVANADGYGIQTTTTASGSGGALGIAAKYLQSGNTVGGLPVSAATLASSTADATNREVVITHKAAVGSLTSGGNYTDTITYSCFVN